MPDFPDARGRKRVRKEKVAFAVQHVLGFGLQIDLLSWGGGGGGGG